MSRQTLTGEEDLRESVEVAVENLEDTRLPDGFVRRIVLGVLRTALLRHRKRDPESRTRSSD